MSAYEPLDLSTLCNAGLDVLGTDDTSKFPLGATQFRGLPFQIGTTSATSERCLVKPDSTVSISVDRAARWAVFAHRQLEPTKPAGHGVGTLVADYVFHLSSGTAVTVPIRERFEIQILGHEWGRFPFRAQADKNDSKFARFAGKWEGSGFRLAEHMKGWPRAFYLWFWENPEPGTTIERIDLVPKGVPFVVGGITVSDLDEEPFVRTPARPVRLTLTDDEAAKTDGVLDLEVDRGTAAYPQPISTEDDRPGWGTRDEEHRMSPAYSTVAALPSATLVVGHKGEEYGRVRWADVERDGSAEDGNVRVELVDPGRNWVHVTVVDDATGQPVPCRVHFRSPEGVPYQPHGHHNHVAQNLESWHYDVGGDVRLGNTTFAYIDGTCQGWLPRGEVQVDVARGFEYEPLREAVRIEPGQRELTLRLKRNTDLAAQGWWSGDSHVHFLSTAGAQLEQRGEDVKVVNLLQAQWGALFTNTEDFTGRPSVIDGGEYVTYVGQENRQHQLGHMLLWGLKKPVMPWSSDGPDEADLGGAMDATLSDWADRTHAQGGTVVAAHFPNPNGEPAVLVATGRADAVEMLSVYDDPLIEYYRYLNSGFQLPLVGGTDKMSSSVPVGIYRTYARLGDDEEFSYDGWCRAVRAGRTFLSGGPLLSFSVEGRQSGDTLALGGPGTVHVEASVTSIFPLAKLEIVCNGQVVAAATASSAAGERQFSLAEDLRIDGHSWVVCRAFGTQHHLDEWGRQVFAHTSPVYVACDGPWGMADPEGLHYIRTLVEGSRDYVRHTAVRRSDALTTHHHGEADHLAWLERPFNEALAALEERRRSG